MIMLLRHETVCTTCGAAKGRVGMRTSRASHAEIPLEDLQPLRDRGEVGRNREDSKIETVQRYLKICSERVPNGTMLDPTPAKIDVVDVLLKLNVK